MRYGSVCSGIEAATMAWHALGWEPAFFSEIEAFPRAVLEHRYPDVPLHGDFTTIGENQYGKIDLLVGGTPCQSFSVAGLRGGLDDERGNLALEFCRLAQRERPRWIVWENVPGVLSSNGGRDFGSILGALAELGYGLAYRVLDAQYFGVAQRRRRVFVVGYLGDWRRAAAVLFERHSLSGHPAPSREKRQDATHPTAPCLTSSGRGVERTGDTRGQDPVIAVDGGGSERAVDWPAGVASTLDTDYATKWGQNNQHVNGGCPLFVPDTVGTLRTRRPGEGGVQGDFDHIVPTVSPAPDTKAYVAFQQNTRDEVRYINGDGQIAGALAAQSGMKQTNYVAYPIDTQNMSPGHNSGGIGFGQDGDPSFTLTKGHSHGVATFNDDGTARTLTARHDSSPCHDRGPDVVAFSSNMSVPDCQTDGSTPTLKVGGHGGGNPPALAYDLRGREGGSQLEGPHDTANIRAASGGSSKSYVATSAVRRLTPVECERLQGFPDGFTAIPWRKKAADDCPDGPRYKALGNSMAVPVMRWIGQRIQMVEDLTSLL